MECNIVYVNGYGSTHKNICIWFESNINKMTHIKKIQPTLTVERQESVPATVSGGATSVQPLSSSKTTEQTEMKNKKKKKKVM